MQDASSSARPTNKDVVLGTAVRSRARMHGWTYRRYEYPPPWLNAMYHDTLATPPRFHVMPKPRACRVTHAGAVSNHRVRFTRAGPFVWLRVRVCASVRARAHVRLCVRVRMCVSAGASVCASVRASVRARARLCVRAVCPGCVSPKTTAAGSRCTLVTRRLGLTLQHGS